MFITVVVGMTWLAVSNSGAGAEEASSTACDPSDQADIVASLSSSGLTATFTVQNANPLCDPVPIGLAVYLKDGPGWVTPQTLFKSSTSTITSGSKSLSVSLPDSGTSPRCFTQIDAFTGSPLPEVTDSQDYGRRFLAGTFGKLANCVEAQTEVPPTTTVVVNQQQFPPPPGTDTTPSAEQPSNQLTSTSPAATVQVEATQTTPTTQAQAAGVQVAGNELARTGPRTNTSLLTVIAGMLLLFGGAMLSWANWPLRRSEA